MADNKVLFSSSGVIYYPTIVSAAIHETKMTSNMSPAPLVAKASSGIPYMAFDGIAGSSRWAATTNINEWISINFGQEKKVNCVTLTVPSSPVASPHLMPKHFKVEGSNDGINWSKLGEYKNVSWTMLNETKKFFLSADSHFKEYKIFVYSINHTASVAIGEILFSYCDIQYNAIPSSSELDFITYGIDIEKLKTDFPPYKLYDFSGDLDVLYYTNDTSVVTPKLEKTLNYSPLDELNGQIEIVTYVDTLNESRKIEYTATPTGQFTNLIDATLADDINSIVPKEINVQNSSVKYVISPDSITWYSYRNGNWVVVDTLNKIDILLNGMSKNELTLLQRNQLKQIIIDKFSIGIIVSESFRVVEEIGVDKIEFGESIRANNAEINKADFSILNTTAEINVTFAGNTLTGNVDDVDKGKVQYRVFLNGSSYHPPDGSFTILEPSPANLRLTLDPKKVLIGLNNDLRVEFRDAWGNTDVWRTSFIGVMTGLLFVDQNGNYYSTETGTILQQLDFGTIIAGQTTIEHEVKIKNTYGYSVKNIKVAANQQNFPSGLKAQFGTNPITFEGLDELIFNRTLNDGDELSFYIRLASQWGTSPTSSSAFDIKVTADKV